MPKGLLKKNLLLALACLLILALAGCGAEEKTADVAAEPNNPYVYYFDGIISIDGKIRFASEFGKEYLILTDYNEQQRYVLETENTYDTERLNEYNEPLQTACTYRLYDLQGELQKEVVVQAEGAPNTIARFAFDLDGDLADSRVLVNLLASEGKFQILDLDGNLLTEEQVFLPEEEKWQSDYISLSIVGNFMQVFINMYGDDYDFMVKRYFYDLDGQPLALAHEYDYISSVYDKSGQASLDYYVADYTDNQGKSKSDLLDGKGQIVLGGFDSLYHSTNGVFVVERGFERGLMDAQGNWIYKESVFNELED